MPELPEVETIKRGLASKIIGLNLKSVQILNPKTFQGKVEDVEGKKVEKVWRRAKMLGIDLTGDKSLLFHLKMSGQMIFIDQGKKLAGGHPTPDMKDEMPNKSTRVIFEFNDGGVLYFNDQRKFGWIKVLKTSEIDPDKLMTGLGPEPLEKEFSWQILHDRVGKHKNWPIKVALMDQQAIAGVGNIYASEACFNAKLDPQTKVSDLTDSQWKSLFIGLIKALEDGIKYGGSSRAHFVNAEGEKGLFLDYAFVYQRDGEKCKVCGTEIQKVVQAGRSTFFCPKCQK